MPRSPIRRPAKSLDLSFHLIESDQLPEIVTSQTLFGDVSGGEVEKHGQTDHSEPLARSERPLEIEIGSGKGLFLTTEAQRMPKHDFLGIEIISKYARHAAARMAKADQRSESGLKNARMVAGNAEPIFEKRIPAGSLEAVHVYFPDPWWKKRHRKRRVLNEKSIVNYSRSLRPGGRLHFWTDVLDYFESTVELIAEIAPELGVPIPEEEIESTHDLDYRTHFERRSRQNAIPVYRVRYEKRAVDEKSANV